MKVHVRFFAVDIPYDLTGDTLDLPEGSTVETALEEIMKKYNLPIDEKYFKASAVLLNRLSATLKDNLHDQDELTILRHLEGG
jgi:molybdopterin converting factor small subunit